jgi:hypothetical protein
LFHRWQSQLSLRIGAPAECCRCNNAPHDATGHRLYSH